MSQSHKSWKDRIQSSWLDKYWQSRNPLLQGTYIPEEWEIVFNSRTQSPKLRIYDYVNIDNESQIDFQDDSYIQVDQNYISSQLLGAQNNNNSHQQTPCTYNQEDQVQKHRDSSYSKEDLQENLQDKNKNTQSSQTHNTYFIPNLQHPHESAQNLILNRPINYNPYVLNNDGTSNLSVHDYQEDPQMQQLSQDIVENMQKQSSDLQSNNLKDIDQDESQRANHKFYLDSITIFGNQIRDLITSINWQYVAFTCSAIVVGISIASFINFKSQIHIKCQSRLQNRIHFSGKSTVLY